MALSQKDRQQLMVLLIMVAGGTAGLFWYMWRTPKLASHVAMRTEIDSLQLRVDSAKADLAAGTVE
jgi:hypothetical protein